MATFEYAVETFNSDKLKKIEESLDRRGKLGWELVSAMQIGLIDTRLYFKRSVADSRQAAA